MIFIGILPTFEQGVPKNMVRAIQNLHLYGAYLLNITDSSFLLLASELAGEMGRGFWTGFPVAGLEGCVEALL